MVSSMISEVYEGYLCGNNDILVDWFVEFLFYGKNDRYKCCSIIYVYILKLEILM